MCCTTTYYTMCAASICAASCARALIYARIISFKCSSLTLELVINMMLIYIKIEIYFTHSKSCVIQAQYNYIV